MRRSREYFFGGGGGAVFDGKDDNGRVTHTSRSAFSRAI